MSAWSSIERAYLAPVPAERLAALRILIGAFASIWLLALGPEIATAGGRSAAVFAPVGPLRWMSGGLSAPAGFVAVGLALLAALAFAGGIAYRFTGPAFAGLLLFVLGYRNSWGMIFHTENLLVLHAAVLALAPASEAWSWDARRRGSPTRSPGVSGWSLRVMAAVTAATYVVAGVAKLRNAGMDWVSGDVLLHQVAFDNVRKAELGDLHSPIGAWALGFPAIFAPLATISLVVELVAPVALLGRAWAATWSSLAWAFHVGVLAIMAIFFPYPLLGLAFAPMFALERPVLALLRRRAAVTSA